MTRLTNEMRKRICDALLDAKFSDAKKAIEDRKCGLASMIYEAAFSIAERKRMSELPDGWMPKTNNVNAKLNGGFVFVKFADGERRPLPHDKFHGAFSSECLLVADGKNVLCKIHADITDDSRDLAVTEEKLRREINGALYAASTLEKLTTIWPEVKSTAEKIAKARIESTNLPVPKIASLNRELGLKKVA